MKTAITEITIDLTDLDSLAAAVTAGVTTIELLADVLVIELSDDSRVLLLDGSPLCADDGDGERTYDETYDADRSADCRRAAREYVESGDYQGESTTWVDVATYQRGINAAGEIVRVGEINHTITVEPEEPDCDGDHSHVWKSPHAIVGGCRDNPGVHGHGGGVVITECCMICGCRRQTDTWAQRSDTGEQGLTSVEYSEAEYADEVNALHVTRAKDRLEAVQYPDSQYDWVGQLNTDEDAHCDAEGIHYVGLSDDEMREYGIDLLIDSEAFLAPEGISWLSDDEIAEIEVAE